MPLRLQKQQIYLIVGIALALFAVMMIKLYLDQQQRRVEESAAREFERRQANQISVLVAKKDIPRGTIIDPDSFDVGIFPKEFVQPGAITSLDRIAGMMTIAAISKGEQITLSKLSYTRPTGSLAEVTPPGKRAITISVDNVSALAGMIKAGDYVDVIALLPVPTPSAEGKTTSQMAVLPLFQNVLVLAVGQETSVMAKEEPRYKKEEKKEVSPLITLALTPQEANLIAFVQEQGKIRLVLRSPGDVTTTLEPIQPTSWESLFQYLFPQRLAKPEEPKPSDYVEIIRGLNREKVLLSK